MVRPWQRCGAILPCAAAESFAILRCAATSAPRRSPIGSTTSPGQGGRRGFRPYCSSTATGATASSRSGQRPDVAETPFFVSPNEVEFCSEQSDKFHLYRLLAFRDQPRMLMLSGTGCSQLLTRPSELSRELAEQLGGLERTLHFDNGFAVGRKATVRGQHPSGSYRRSRRPRRRAARQASH